MKFLVVFLLLLVCGPTRAATMCVPDLSTCESCTDFEDFGMILWSANCCGVPVSGFWLGYSSNERSVDIAKNDLIGAQLEYGGMGYNVCVMMSPIVAPYAVNVKHDWILNSSVCKSFIPRCAMTYCDETVPKSSSGGMP